MLGRKEKGEKKIKQYHFLNLTTKANHSKLERKYETNEWYEPCAFYWIFTNSSIMF